MPLPPTEKRRIGCLPSLPAVSAQSSKDGVVRRVVLKYQRKSAPADPVSGVVSALFHVLVFDHIVVTVRISCPKGAWVAAVTTNSSGNRIPGKFAMARNQPSAPRAFRTASSARLPPTQIE